MERGMKVFGAPVSPAVLTLAKDYSSVNIINLKTDKLETAVVKNSLFEALRETLERCKGYEELACEFAAQFVMPEDRASYISLVSIEAIRRELAKNDRYNYTFHLSGQSGGAELIEMRISTIEGEEDKAMMTFKQSNVRKLSPDIEKNSKLIERSRVQINIDNIVSAMSALYFTVYRIDVLNNRHTEIKASEAISKFASQFSTAEECLEAMTENLIETQYRSAIAELVDMSKWQEKLAEKDSITEEYEGVITGWCRMSVVVLGRDRDNHVTETLICVKDINEEKQVEIKHKEELKNALLDQKKASAELEDALHREKTQNAIISGTSKPFFSLFAFNYKTKNYIVVKEYEKFVNYNATNYDAKAALKHAVDYLVKEEFQPEMRAFLNLDTLEERMQNSDIITQDYLGHSNVWSRAIFIVSERDENGGLDRVLFGVRRVEDGKNKELLQDKLIKALSLGYDNMYSVDINSGRTICFRMGEFISVKYGNVYSEGHYEKNIKHYVSNEVYEEDMRLFEPILTLENMKTIFSKVQNYVINYRVLRQGEMHYFQCQAAMPSEKEEVFVIGFKNVDAEMIEELKQKEVLRSALAAAEHANRAKTRFLSNMSHDIRTPLNAILGYTRLSLNHIDEQELVKNYLERIDLSGNHLVSLVNEVLDMSRIESGKNFVDVKEENLKDILFELKSIALVNVNLKNQELVFDDSEVSDRPVLLDKLKFSQILINILSNAIKYTNVGGRIEFIVRRMNTTWDDYDLYEFVVSDNGIGMNEEFLSRIYEPFEREHNSTVSGVQGTGLGMSITKNLIDILGGTINITSEKNNGTTVVVQMQFRHAENTERAEDEKSISFSGRRVLIVEDNELNREIDVELLSEVGFVVDTANNGLEAYELIKNSQPGKYELVLMDIQMPVMNGYEATERIRALEDPLLARIPIVALTANAFDEDRNMAIKSGMNEFISKPIEMPKLISTISEFLNK